MRICKVKGCGKKHHGLGFCFNHYSQHKKGTLYRRTRRTPNEIIVEGDIAKIALYTVRNKFIAYSIIDAADVDLVKDMKWGIAMKGYVSCGTPKPISLHKYLMGESSLFVDHINGDRLDNRRGNLRFANNAENMRNRTKLPAHNASGVIGVGWYKKTGRWKARITVNYKDIHLGYFTSFEDAVAVRKQAEKDYFGEFAPKI